jgi:hypothetical protein
MNKPTGWWPKSPDTYPIQFAGAILAALGGGPRSSALQTLATLTCSRWTVRGVRSSRKFSEKSRLLTASVTR